MANQEKKKIRISVRTLVEFLLRSGDLDRRTGGVADKEAMLAGGRMHRKIQKESGGDYRAEVPLAEEAELGSFVMRVEGRADGIYTKDLKEFSKQAFRTAAEGIEDNTLFLVRENEIKEELSTKKSSGDKCTPKGSMGMESTASQQGKDKESTASQQGTNKESTDSEQGAEKNADVSLQESEETEETLSLLQRMGVDGARRSEKNLSVVDEIKGMYLEPSLLDGPVPVHLAQAKCYAAMLANAENLPEVGICMTYVQLENEHLRRFFFLYTNEELRGWFDALLAEWEKWATWKADWERTRDASMETLTFPFPYREGQRGLVAAVYRTIERGGELFLMAPTGTGKTLATVYPAVRSLREGCAERIFYLTAKNQTLAVAWEAFSILREHGLRLKVVRITARDKACFLSTPTCDPDHCPYAKGHFDRINEVVFSMLNGKRISGCAIGKQNEIMLPLEEQSDEEFRQQLAKTNGMLHPEKTSAGTTVPCNKTSPDKKQEHRNIIPYNKDKNGYTDKCEADFFDLSHIREVAEAAKVCPFELALELSSWCDAILCDYNYAFDPHAYLRRFFGENADGGSVLLVDEAHNLVERGRSMYSAMLSKANVLAAKKVLKTARPKAARALEKLNKSLLALQKTLPEENAENVRNNQKCRILSPAWLSGEGEADGKFEHGTVFDTEETIGRKEAALKTVSLRTFSFLTGGAEKRVLSEEKGKMVDAVPSGREQLQTVYTNALRAVAELDAFFKEERGSHLREEVLDFYFELRTFVDTFEAMQEDYIAYGAMDEDKHFFFELFCADPSRRLTEMAERAGAAIFFSATLLPIDYYRRLLTTHENVPAIYAKSAFDEKNRLVLIGRGVTTRYKDRGIAMYRKIAGYIRALARGKVGNYLAFFPSYQLLYEVLKVYREEFDEQGINFVAQGRGMDELGREIFMENFYEDPRESLVGFCVMGGMFAEGIDLTGTRLIGAVIVGTGLPQVGFQTELLRRYFAELSLDGFQTAYQIPGMSKVLQAGGRVIRTATDRGVILLLDDRFIEASTRQMFPREWAGARICREEELPRVLAEFWEGG